VTLASTVGDVNQSTEGPDSRDLFRMMGELIESNRQTREETRALNERVELMQKAGVFPLTMGVTTPVSLLSPSRYRTSATPFGSQFSALDGGVRRPLFVPPPVVKAPPPSTVAEETGHGPGPTTIRDPPPPKVNPPKSFSGKLAERNAAETWLGLAMNWLTIAGKNQPESIRVLMFGMVLESEAHTWFQTMQQAAVLENKELTVQLLCDLFLAKFVGGTAYMVRQQELTSLTYGKGKCVDAVSTQTEFERLASSLFPGASLNPQTDQLLAMAFADVYKRGDLQLWEKAVERSPVTLDEWKAAVQNAESIRQYVIDGKKAAQRAVSQMGMNANRSFHSSSSSSIGRINQMDGNATDEDEDSSEGKEGEPGVPEKLQQMKGTKKGGTRSQDKKKTFKVKLLTTWQERQKLQKRGQCFHCFQQGHRVESCPDIDKPARRPTEEELNL
jgi:hypothetical protein